MVIRTSRKFEKSLTFFLIFAFFVVVTDWYYFNYNRVRTIFFLLLFYTNICKQLDEIRRFEMSE